MNIKKLLTAYFVLLMILSACQQFDNTMNDKHTNLLVEETSPYLLQHAHNPVNWMPWGDEALQKAKDENKLLLVSIGYSACHWCHVMEHETFEDSAAAALMNKYFVPVKVDREERPDIDNFYMGAVQLMTGQGGWPLNCVALPDGRPIWGGTYFKTDVWMKSLEAIYDVYINDNEKVLAYAEKLENGIKQTDLVDAVEVVPNFTEADLQDLVENWKRRFDHQYGGPNKAPKFPLPNNYQFLLRYGWFSGDEAVENHVEKTLQEMAFGGICDQIGGGFSRYSTDVYWKAPHFEKMLYDNAQLISLYSEGYRVYKNPLYKDVVEETVAFLLREMRGEEQQFYAALDADSEGEEGKFYVWQKPELQQLISENDWAIFEDYYNINSTGRWEHGNYILLRTRNHAEISAQHKITELELQRKVATWKTVLLAEREKRIRPGLDNKALTAWNAMMVEAFADAYLAFNEKEYYNLAIETAEFIQQKLLKPDGQLWHTYSPGEAKINAFLDDYAAVIQAWLKMFEMTGDEKYLREAENLTQIVLADFDAGASGLFFYTAKSSSFISRTTELSDNVIPASNSVMAHNLEKLGVLLENVDYRERAQKMAMQIKENMYSYGEGYSNWAMLMLSWIYPQYEVAISGIKAEQIKLDFDKKYYPNLIFSWSEKASNLPLLQNRFVADQTTIYICQGNVCQLPVTKVDSAWNFLKK